MAIGCWYLGIGRISKRVDMSFHIGGRHGWGWHPEVCETLWFMKIRGSILWWNIIFTYNAQFYVHKKSLLLCFHSNSLPFSSRLNIIFYAFHLFFTTILGLISFSSSFSETFGVIDRVSLCYFFIIYILYVFRVSSYLYLSLPNVYYKFCL